MLFRTLRASVERICGAADFGTLQAELVRLFSSLMDSDAWTGAQQAIFRVALERLTELSHYQNQLRLDCPAPFALFLDLLGWYRYTPSSTGGGIEVYPYHQAAGLAKRHLFVLNSTQEATGSILRPFAFLPEESAAYRLNERDVSASLIDLYAVCNQTIHFSYSRSVFGRATLPAAHFMASRANIEPTRPDPDGYQNEVGLWLGHTEWQPTRVYPLQRRGVSAMVAPNAGDYTQQPVAHGSSLTLLLATLRPTLHTDPTADPTAAPGAGSSAGSTADGMLIEGSDDSAISDERLQFSATSLEQYGTCPWGFLIGRCLRIDPSDRDPDPESAMRIGSIYHRALRQLYDWIAKQGPLSADRLADYRQQAQQICASLRIGGLSPPVAAAVRLRLGEVLEFVLESDLERFDGFRVQATELERLHVLTDQQVVLTGTIDRLLQEPESGMVVIGEYKKRRLPSRREITGGKQTVALAKPQLIFYLLLAGEPRAAAYYYSLEGRKLQTVFGATDPQWLSADERDELRARLRLLIGEQAARLRAGDFRPPDPHRGCEQCAYRGICRLKFHFG